MSSLGRRPFLHRQLPREIRQQHLVQLQVDISPPSSLIAHPLLPRLVASPGKRVKLTVFMIEVTIFFIKLILTNYVLCHSTLKLHTVHLVGQQGIALSELVPFQSSRSWRDL